MAQVSLVAGEEPKVQATVERTSRLYFVDHLRTALVILVVVHHIAVVYGGIPPFYYVEPPFTDPDGGFIALVFVLFNQAWFMGAFFLLAGYFTPGSFDRKGSGAFLKDRLVRLGIPIIVFMLVLSPIASLGFYLMPSTLTGITSAPTWQDYSNLIGLGPLWFVTMLLLFSIGYVLWRRLIGKRESAPSPHSTAPSYVQIVVFVLALALANYLIRMAIPLGQSVSVIAPPISFPTLAYLPEYVSFFVLGVVAARNDWLRTLPRSMGIAGFAAALLASVVLFPLAVSGQWFSLELTNILNAFGNGHWQSGVYALWDSIFAVGLFMGAVTLFRGLLNGKSRLGRFLAEQSYAVYILHVVVIVYVAYALRDVALPALVKIGVVSLIVVPVCFLIAYVVRRLPLASKVL